MPANLDFRATARERHDVERLNDPRDDQIAGSIGEVFYRMTPAQADDWIETNVVDLATARRALKIVARLLLALGRPGHS